VTRSTKIENALVIDDDDLFRTTLGSSLRRRGLKVRTAASVEEGLFVVEDGLVDLLIVDQRMPRGNGLDALARFRRHLPEAVIVMLTGFGDIPLAVEAVREGADTLLSKPIDPDQLLRVAVDLRARPRISSATPASPLCLNLEEMEREAIRAALKEAGGVVWRAAKLLGIDRRTLQRKMRRFG
jgi:two-component system response regulator RegA